MANICLTLYRNGFFASVPKSPTQMGSLSVYNSVTNISCLGTFKLLTIDDRRKMLSWNLIHHVQGEYDIDY